MWNCKACGGYTPSNADNPALASLCVNCRWRLARWCDREGLRGRDDLPLIWPPHADPNPQWKYSEEVVAEWLAYWLMNCARRQMQGKPMVMCESVRTNPFTNSQCSFWAQVQINGRWVCHKHKKAPGIFPETVRSLKLNVEGLP